MAIHGERPGPFWSLMRHTCIRESEADRVHNCPPAGAPRRGSTRGHRVSAGGDHQGAVLTAWPPSTTRPPTAARARAGDPKARGAATPPQAAPGPRRPPGATSPGRAPQGEDPGPQAGAGEGGPGAGDRAGTASPETGRAPPTPAGRGEEPRRASADRPAREAPSEARRAEREGEAGAEPTPAGGGPRGEPTPERGAAPERRQGRASERALARRAVPRRGRRSPRGPGASRRRRASAGGPEGREGREVPLMSGPDCGPDNRGRVRGEWARSTAEGKPNEAPSPPGPGTGAHRVWARRPTNAGDRRRAGRSPAGPRSGPRFRSWGRSLWGGTTTPPQGRCVTCDGKLLNSCGTTDSRVFAELRNMLDSLVFW